ncbi:MAG: Crp/Fnr family transcriptional regulator [Bacteroidia bacterium]
MTPGEPLRVLLNAITPLPEEAMEAMLADWKEVRFRRNEILTQPGQVQRDMLFILEGLQRSYYIKDGKEHVIAFTYPPSFSGIPESFLTQQPSRYFLQALTDGKMLKLPWERLEAIAQAHPSVERLLRLATAQVLGGLVQRHYELLALSSEERFVAFMERSAHLINLVPHKQIASYLGMDPTNFSKLLNSRKL